MLVDIFFYLAIFILGAMFYALFSARIASLKGVAAADTTKIEQGVLTEMHRLVDASKLDATRIEEYIVAHTLYLKALARKLVFQSPTTPTAPVAAPEPEPPSV